METKKRSVDANELSMDAALQFVGADIVKSQRDGELVVNCPRKSSNHGGKGVPKTFGVNVNKGQFKCFRECADCVGHGGPANLVRVYYPNMTFSEACNALGEFMGGREVYHPRAVQVREISRHEETKKAGIETLDAVYRDLLSMLKLNENHKQDFIRRGLTEDQIEEFMIRSIPGIGLQSIPISLRKHYSLKGVPLFGKKNGSWVLNMTPGKTGVFVPYFDLQGRIQQLQIRYDIDPNAADPEEEKKNRYRWGTSSTLEDGTSATNVTFWGRLSRMGTGKNYVIVTEGGIKANVASYLSEEPVVAVPGVTCYSCFEEIVSWCKEHGKYIIEAFDMDGKRLPNEVKVNIDLDDPPKSVDSKIVEELRFNPNRFLLRNKDTMEVRLVNDSVRRGIKKMYGIAKEAGVGMVPFIWDPEFKGVDDYLLHLKETNRTPTLPTYTAPEPEKLKFEACVPMLFTKEGNR